MVQRNLYFRFLLITFATMAFGSSALATTPVFDAHLHYNQEDSDSYSAQDILSLLSDNGVDRAVFTGRPPHLARQLHELAPRRIVPILGVYRELEDKAIWVHDRSLPVRVEQQLSDPAWRGIGELHLFARDRHSPVFQRLVDLATVRRIPLLMHCDPAVIDALFEHAPDAIVVWAHAGAYPYPPLLRDYLERYPNLHMDLSVREDRVAPDGEIDWAWQFLLMEIPDRFLVGVDTYRTARWDGYPEIIAKIRTLLNQLPPDAAAAIGHENAERLFLKQLPD
jgi:hypothetical protein